MIKSYFKTALRGFKRHKLFTFINVIGLSIGISACLVIYMIVHYDLTFDKFHKDSDRIYRVVSYYTFQGEKGYNSGVCGPLPGALKTQATGIETVAPFFTLYQPNVFVAGNGNVPVRFKNQDDVVLAGPEYFKIFNYTWLAGNAKSALDAPNQVVLTDEQAAKYFPKLDYHQVIGKIVTYDTVKTTVTGIVQKLKQNSDFTFHDFISYTTGTAVKDLKDQLQLTEWESTTSASQLFIKVSPTTNAAALEKQINVILKKASPPKKEDKGNTHGFKLQPLSDLHFNGDYGNFDNGHIASKTTLYSLMLIGVFLLILGCINFINLTTAQAAQRAKEIGIRKTMGSDRKQLIFQFLSETFLVTTTAVIISAVLSPFILKLFSDFVSPNIKADFIGQPVLIVFLVVLTVVVTLFAGFYPAILLSSYKPVQVLKGQSATNNSKTRKALLRKSLTVTQFVIAQFFIIGTILVSKQVYYALHKDLGFKKDAIIVMNTPWKNRTDARNQVLVNAFRALPQVERVSIGGNPPSSGGTNSTEVTYMDGKKEIKTDVQLKFADENYMDVYRLKVVAGRKLQASDSGKYVVINQNYATLLGFKNPHDIIGKTLEHFNSEKKLEVAGVVADFHQKSLHDPIKPMAIYIGRTKFMKGYLHIGLRPETPGGNEWKTAIASMQKTWKQVYPDDDFDYSFFDQNIAKFYDAEQHTSSLLRWATALSIFISCLGLLGLAIYTTNQRTKEIGVRKVLGASVASIVRLLSAEMMWLILLSFILVTPLAWLGMNKWMQSFADRTTISWWIFALSGTGMLLAALFTSSFQTIKAAIANPVKSLRSE
ncbi:ABC transporter permease [Mucilaginibacter sp. L3T2-6]|uniref:ABC transporter permease n=1 Tax=Mucilaginibacter sp. L3T2-6 TaxID=3062491 RepID=UPI00267595A4|nr:ABC transporter permease [Mucilaginibacter sp. L3T2-6]MDO3644968.1 ABC transporter permease [Mucilaginibacter sp. L3T2-6]MDV6217406.1 ABC transporter permease [Mucilaginibacter sp. L3T2-6]